MKPARPCSGFLWAAVFLILAAQPRPSAAANDESLASMLDWGGYVRLRGSISFPKDGSVLDLLHRDRLHDGAFEARLTTEFRKDRRVRFNLDYEIIGTAGETDQVRAALAKQFPADSGLPLLAGPVKDDRRLLDLTQVIAQGPDDLLYHRIDRLVLTLSPDWGVFRIGRQALTWGNGFLFNPMDLFNPFSPTDVERDYKIGDDMIEARVPAGSAGEMEMLYVPRRDPASGKVEWGQSSLAAKYHFSVSTYEFDLMAARHYGDDVAGAGVTGYLKDAAWRMDATWTALHDDGGRPGFLSFVANIDYSWVWRGKNLYGWIEYYYTGLGASDYTEAAADAQITERIARGERYTLGRSYVDGNLQLEVHPLLDLYLTVITNTQDPSAVLQPRMVYNPFQDWQVTSGVNIYFGGENTEFNGFPLPGTRLTAAPADAAYLWASYYF